MPHFTEMQITVFIITLILILKLIVDGADFITWSIRRSYILHSTNAAPEPNT
jgi:hypothetical protein